MITSAEIPNVSFDDFVGHDEAKHNLRIAIAAAKARGTRLPHMLITSGYGGVGKTLLVEAIAGEMGVPLLRLDVTAGATANLRMIERARPRTIVFFDEFHRGVEGNKRKLDYLLEPIEAGLWMTEEGAQQIPDVTFMAATTDAGMLPATLRGRFDEVVLSRPDDADAKHISLVIACKVIDHTMPLPKADGSCVAVARAANNNPRQMRKLWKAIADGWLADPDAHFHDGDYDLAPVLARKRLTPEGLDMLAVRYLFTMDKTFPEGCGKARIAEVLNEPSGVAAAEATLIDKGLLMYVSKGRKLTKAGRDWVWNNEELLSV